MFQRVLLVSLFVGLGATAVIELGAAPKYLPAVLTSQARSVVESGNPLRAFRGQPVLTAGLRGNNCSQASCHGDQSLKGPEGKEQVIWTAEDAHNRAFVVLQNKRSERMIKLLTAKGDTSEYSASVPAYETVLCLKCHGLNAPNTPDSVKLDPKSGLHVEGVGCEACHGASDKWLTVHYQDFWKGLTESEKSTRYGLLPTKDLAYRTQMCASCHIGQPDQEVNHDLIAAGHPALRFEASAYHNHRDYNPHWLEKGYGSDFEMRNWLIGQVASMRASLELTRDRALRASRDQAVWPELSEFNCFSCHHDLKGGTFDKSNISPSLSSWTEGSWRSSKLIAASRPKDVSLGVAGWGTWYMPLADALIQARDLTGAPSSLRSTEEEPFFGRMDQLMHKRFSKELKKSIPEGRPEEVAAECSRRIADLDLWLTVIQDDADRNSKTNPWKTDRAEKLTKVILADTLDTNTKRWSPFEWESAGQRTLSVLALYSAATRKNNPSALKALEKDGNLKRLQSWLSLQPGTNSATFYDPADVKKTFEELSKALTKQEQQK